ncbi:hypothetical protein JUJ52_03170 [Virgibacillus sp. AGTR]|uniref:hypothetical protein n=1 Tax=Virgibacillus sp. AGTR TaxID=2812055 RepID=UPI001D16A89E|nr:hypothetical protein [Virgibacillus sp. AGTR]MCC2248959.1 hypothetical protein [Virgibacillus sp. AGTR]
MKKIIGIIFLIVLVCLFVIPFTSWTLPKPVTLSVATDNTKIPVKYGLYCGDAFLTNKCDTIEKVDISTLEAVEVSPNSTVKFNFEEKPDELQIIREDKEGNEKDRKSYLDDDKNNIIIPNKAGIHYYSIEAKWDDKSRSAYYYFSIKVI